MAIVISLINLVGLVVVACVLLRMLNRNHDAIKEVYHLVYTHELDRKHAKCSGLFARVMRALDKENVEYSYSRPQFNHMTFQSGNVTITIGIRENHGAYETGQFVACMHDYPTIHSCEEELSVFARQIKQAFAAGEGHLQRVRSGQLSCTCV